MGFGLRFGHALGLFSSAFFLVLGLGLGLGVRVGVRVRVGVEAWVCVRALF